MYNVFGSLGDNAVYSAELNEIIFVTASVPVNVSPTFVITLPLALPDKKFIAPVIATLRLTQYLMKMKE
jgi:hypothetical protein